MRLICNGTTICFDHRIETSNGFLLAAKFEPVETMKETALASLKAGTNIKASDLHAKLGHVNDEYMRATAKAMGLEVTGTLKTCESCAIGKAKQKNLSKHDERQSTHPGELVYLDIAGMKKPSKGKKRLWVIFVDSFSGCIISRFIQHKYELASVGTAVLQELESLNISVKTIRCDNAGENRVFETICKQVGLKTQFEYTAPGTPQQNGVAERMFATLFGRIRFMNTAAGLRDDDKLRHHLWAEAANCAKAFNNIVIKKTRNKTPHELFFGKTVTYATHLRIFGEVGVIRDIETVKEKLQDRGSPCIFVGYAEKHAGNVYRMYNIKTGQLRLSRDVKWLGRLYKDHDAASPLRIGEDVSPGNGEDDVDGDDDDNISEVKEPIIKGEVDNEDEDVPTDDGWRTVKAGRETLQFEERQSGQTRAGTIYKSTESANVATNRYSTLYDSDDDSDIDEDAYDDDEPLHFNDAWNHPSKKERKSWREAIRKEFNDMKKRGVWRKTKQQHIPENKRLIGCKWVFKHKKDGRYRARLCALGYSQVPREDFMDTASPDVDDITVRMVISNMLMQEWESEVVDVTTAFLHGNMEEEVYMKCPEGLDLVDRGWVIESDCVELIKTIYGTKQAARQYWKIFIEQMTMKRFEQTHADSCLLKRKDENGTVLICVYVGDCLLTGDRMAIDIAMKDIEETFETRRLGPLHEYIGCTFLDMKDGPLKMIQPDMIKKLESSFGDKVEYIYDASTPLGPGTTIVRPGDDDERIDQEEQREYRSGVGMVLYLVKHSRRDISNAARELSKVMDGAIREHVKLLYRVIKFVLVTKHRGIHIKLDPSRKVVAFVDSDFADKENRKSITGYLIYLYGVPIAWKSKQQGDVTLSSSEAEYYAISEVGMELKFVSLIMDFIEIDSSIPMKVYVDNIRAIHLANNASTGTRTKHIDTRQHFVRELAQGDNKILDIEFVRSDENQSDTFTKNTTTELFCKHTTKYMIDVG
jgi:hypothetical protein